FALKRYAESAAALNAVLAVGPGWDWKTLISLYPDTATYEAQLRALEDARDRDPKGAHLRFLVGYHYLTMGHTDVAQSAFRRAAELEPKDTVAAALAATLSPRATQLTQPPAGSAPKPVPANDVTGSWTAAGRGSAKYSMSLQKDGTFTWAF